MVSHRLQRCLTKSKCGKNKLQTYLLFPCDLVQDTSRFRNMFQEKLASDNRNNIPGDTESYLDLSYLPSATSLWTDTPTWSDTSPCRHPPGRYPPGQTHPSRRLLQRTVRILLECILVYSSVTSTF